MEPKLRRFRAELHVHTVLSPCADVSMIPPLIVEEAVSKKIDIIAITDHNSTWNVEAVQKAAEEYQLTILPGMELQTKEEIHLLCLFDRITQSSQFQEFVNHNMPPINNNVDFFGEQFVVDSTGKFLRRENQLLITSSNITLTHAVEKVNELGGIAIPAHVDAKAFGLIYVLGLIPEDIKFPALEISRHITPEQARITYPQIKGYPLIQDGDVHFYGDMLGVNEFLMTAATVEEVKAAFYGINGRNVSIRQNLP